MFTYTPKGVCARQIQIQTDGDVIREIRFIGGCSGNTQGIGALCTGMKIDDVITRLEGIRCGFKPTSCPDQLSIALRQLRDSQ